MWIHLQIYGIYKFATIYLWIHTRSTTLYDNYGLYKNFQSLLMQVATSLGVEASTRDEIG